MQILKGDHSMCITAALAIHGLNSCVTNSSLQNSATHKIAEMRRGIVITRMTKMQNNILISISAQGAHLFYVEGLCSYQTSPGGLLLLAP